MKGIYTRTLNVYDNKFGEAVEIAKGLSQIRKKYYPDHVVSFSVQIGGNPRSIRETLDSVFAAVPYCIDLIGGPYITTEKTVVDTFRPPHAIRE